MSTDTEARKAVERVVRKMGPACEGLPDSELIFIPVGSLRTLLAAAKGCGPHDADEPADPACTFCGGPCVVDGGCPDYFVRCLSDDCEAVGPTRRTKATAVEAFEIGRAHV